MENHQPLGAFEELILLVTAVLHDKAYGVNIFEYLSEYENRNVNISAVHVVLRRLEAKGFVTSRYGGVTRERGGRRKKYYTITRVGKMVLDAQYATRTSFYQKIPEIQFN